MTWEVRLAEARDFEAVRDMAKQNWRESCPDREWSGERMRTTFFDDYLEHSEAIIFVVEQGAEVVGFMLTGVYRYRAFDGLFTVQEVMFVRPDKRGTRAAALLMKKLIDWSRDVVGASEIQGGNDNDVRSDQTARFLSRFGFRNCGHMMRLDLDGRR